MTKAYVLDNNILDAWLKPHYRRNSPDEVKRCELAVSEVLKNGAPIALPRVVLWEVQVHHHKHLLKVERSGNAADVKGARRILTAVQRTLEQLQEDVIVVDFDATELAIAHARIEVEGINVQSNDYVVLDGVREARSFHLEPTLVTHDEQLKLAAGKLGIPVEDWYLG